MGKKLTKPQEPPESSTRPQTDGNMSSLMFDNVIIDKILEESTGPIEDIPIGSEFTHHNNRQLTIDDFELLKVLGKGSFGKVMLVKKKDEASNELYAMKTLRKAALLKRNQIAHTTTERTILQTIHCPFLVHLRYAFQTPDKL